MSYNVRLKHLHELHRVRSEVMLWTWRKPRSRDQHRPRCIPLRDAVPSGCCSSCAATWLSTDFCPAVSRVSSQCLFPVPPFTDCLFGLCFVVSQAVVAFLFLFTESKDMVKHSSAACGEGGHVTSALWRCLWAQAEPPHHKPYATLTLAFSDFWWLSCAMEAFPWINTNQKCLRWQT